MPTSTPQADPELPLDRESGQPAEPAAASSDEAASLSPVPSPASEPARPDGSAPLSFVPHTPLGTRTARIRAARYGELDEHELIHLLDSIEDERARARFRESIYISLFFWLAMAWVIFYGPRYLWHAPKLVNPVDVLRQREVVQLNPPVLAPHVRPPAPRPAPRVDNRTLQKLRESAPAPAPTPPAPAAAQPTPVTPAPSAPAPAAPIPAAPRPQAPVAEAPLPQAPTRPSFNTPGSAGDAIQQAMRNSAQHPGGGSLPGGPSSGPLNTGVDILSDTKGVNFNPYLQRILREIYEEWLPLIPEEARPPLSKQGTTQIRFTILPDGTIGAMHLDGSSHDDALNRAAWGSIVGVGQFPPLPKQFTGPNLELRIHYLVNKQQE